MIYARKRLLRLRNSAMALIFSAAQYQYNIAAMEVFLRLLMAIERPKYYFYLPQFYYVMA
jgi:hypothetical protein